MKKERFESNIESSKVFSLGVLLAVFVFWLFHFFTRSAYIDTYFITDHHDTSMDYFNMLANLNHADPWYANANYPAICFLFWKVMHRFLPYADYSDGFTLRENMIAQLGYFLFILICIIIIWEVIQNVAKGSKTEKTLFSAALLFSGPMFFVLERGNILLAVLAFSMLFLALYDSEKFWLRVIAYVALSIAAAIKLYPAVLGLLVLWKKRYKETALLIVLGASAFFLPFFVFDGIDSLIKMLGGIVVATEVQTGLGLGCNYCLSNFIQMIAALFGDNLQRVPGWVPVLGAVGCLGLFFISNCEWQKLYALVLLCIWYPTFSYTYTLVLLFLPILSFFFRNEKEKQKKSSLFYTISFVMLVIPYALPMVDRINNALQLDYVKFPVSWGMLIINAMLGVIAVVIAIENCVRIMKNRSQRMTK